MAFKDKLKELREANNMTQSQLASLINVTTRTLQNYETGRSYPKNQSIIMKLCGVFNCEPNVFLTPEDDFLQEVAQNYGSRGVRQAQNIIAQTNALFAGGELDEADQEAFMQAITEIYFESKRKAKKYAPNKFKK